MNRSHWWQRLPAWVYQPMVADAILLIVILLYYLHFTLPSLAGGFADDEMMNLWGHWSVGLPKSLWANICFWTGFGRPGGALYYLPLYYSFSLNPQPYRITQVCLVAASIPLIYYSAKLLAASRSTAFLATLAVAYHARMTNLTFVGSFIYDVLAALFYFAALTYYLHIRTQSRALRPAQLLLFLVFYIYAINCKEMAVTLPVITFTYELLHCPRVQNWKELYHNNWRFAVPSLVAGILTIPYVCGKMFGNNALANVAPYQPKFSWHRFATTNAHFLNELFYHAIPNNVGPTAVVAIAWVIAFGYAWLRRDRRLLFMASWVVIVPLPIAFILPPRGGGCLYLLLFGWAMILADMAWQLIVLASKATVLLRGSAAVGAITGAIIGGGATNTVRGVAIAAGVGVAVARIPRAMFRLVGTALIALALAMFTQWQNDRSGRVPAILTYGQKSIHVAEAFRALHIQPKPGSKILLMPERPFYYNKLYPMFVAYLVWNDPSLQIHVAGEQEAAPHEMATMDYVISLTEFSAKLERSPGSGGS